MKTGNLGLTITAYGVAALAEIAGSFAFWAWLRQGKSALWLAPGMVSLAFFAFLLTQSQAATAGRAFAAYGGIYIVSSIIWMAVIEGKMPDRWDVIGATICVIGAAIILLGPHTFP